MYKNINKGISDFISTVLIIAITISVGIVLFNWIEPLSREQADKISQDSTDKLKCQSASLRITEGKLNFTSSNLSVSADNTGTVDLSDFSFNIVLTNGTNVNPSASPAITLKPSNKQTMTTATTVTNNVSLLKSVRLISKCNAAITIYDDLDGNTFLNVT